MSPKSPGTLEVSLTLPPVNDPTTEPFVAEVRGDDPEVAAKLRIEERELEGVGGQN